MANQNTVVDALRNAGISPDQPLTLTNPGGGVVWLFTLPATSVANAGAPVVLEVPTVAANGVEVGPLAGHNESTSNLWYADSNMFLVRAQGRVSPSVFGKTLQLNLYAGNGLQAPAPGALRDIQMGSGSVALPVQASNDAFSNWFIEAKCLWDSASLYLNGVFSGMIAGTALAATGFSIYNPSAWLAQQAAGAYSPLPFVIGATIASSASGANDLVVLEEFTAEQL